MNDMTQSCPKCHHVRQPAALAYAKAADGLRPQPVRTDVFVARQQSQASMACERKLQELGGVGVPFLMVKGKPMKNGFDSDEFLALLKS